MHLNEHSQCDFTHRDNAHLGELGFDPISAIFTGAAIKDIFGIGKKKRAMAANVEQNAGYYVSQFGPSTDFSKILSLSAQSALGKRMGAKTMGEEFDMMKGRNDSILVKNKIATPEDYAAYTVLEWTKMDIGCDPNQRDPNHRWYKHCPIDRTSGINIFDTPRLEKYYGDKAKAMAAAKISAPSPTVKAPPEIIPPGQLSPASFGGPNATLNPTQGGFDINSLLRIFGAQQAQPQVTVAAPPTPKRNYLMDGLFVVGTGLAVYALTRPKKRGK